MKAILLPRNYFKFPLVKVIVSKIAYKSLITTKNVRFLRTDHRNVVHENFFRDLGDIICIKNLFKPIRVINRTISWAIWTRTSEDIDHLKKWPATPPPKKNSHMLSILITWCIFQKWLYTAEPVNFDLDYILIRKNLVQIVKFTNLSFINLVV